MTRLLALLAPLMLMLLSSCDSSLPPAVTQTESVGTYLGGTPDPGFARAIEPRAFRFPDDHGPHPDFAVEWWYLTGNLATSSGRRFGYQFTLFRVGLAPGETREDSAWRTRQLYMGHVAISDISQGQHHSAERFSRAAAGLAGATNPPLRVWLGPWEIASQHDSGFPMRLRADTEAFTLDLHIDGGDKPIILQGDAGLSRKSNAPGNASYYYAKTRLPTSGHVTIAGERFDVDGNSWLDREWSSSALADDQAGWDWFALQLDDGRDLMFYRMRGIDGRAQRFSQGALIDVDGNRYPLELEDVKLTVLRRWLAPDGGHYPVAWRLRVPEHELDLQVEAAFDNQLMAHTVSYWEGAVTATGSHTGVGYLELSGYATTTGGQTSPR